MDFWMIKSIPRFALLLVLTASSNVLACSFAPGYQQFRFSENRVIGTGEAPPTPTVSVGAIKRGFDDGNFASCSDAGVLTLVVESHKRYDTTGYLFRLESGSLGSTEFLGEYLAPIELDDGIYGFRIVWLDWTRGQRRTAPVSARLAVRAVSATGVESGEIVVDIRHPGG